MHDFLAKARGIDRSRIMAGGVPCERRKHAAVPSADFPCAGGGLLIRQVEAIARWTKVRAHPATQAFPRRIFPYLILEQPIQTGLDIRRLHGSFDLFPSLFRLLCPISGTAGEKLAVLFKEILSFFRNGLSEHRIAYIAQQNIRALLPVRVTPNRRTEAAAQRPVARLRQNNSIRAACGIERVFYLLCVEDPVQCR